MSGLRLLLRNRVVSGGGGDSKPPPQGGGPGPYPLRLADASFDPAVDLTATQKLWWDKATGLLPGASPGYADITDHVASVKQGGNCKNPAYLIARGLGRYLNRDTLCFRAAPSTVWLDDLCYLWRAVAGRLVTRSNNGYTFRTYGWKPNPVYKCGAPKNDPDYKYIDRDTALHDWAIVNGPLMVACDLLDRNRAVTSPAGYDYGAIADDIEKYLFEDQPNMFWSGWPFYGYEGKPTKPGTYPFLWRHFRHPQISNVLYYYFGGNILKRRGNDQLSQQFYQIASTEIALHLDEVSLGPDGNYYYTFATNDAGENQYLAPVTYQFYQSSNLLQLYFEGVYVDETFMKRATGWFQKAMIWTPQQWGNDLSRKGGYDIAGNSVALGIHKPYAGIAPAAGDSYGGSAADDYTWGKMRRNIIPAPIWHDDALQTLELMHDKAWGNSENDQPPNYPAPAGSIFLAHMVRGTS